MVKKTDGMYTTNIEEMDSVLRALWKSINMRYETEPEPSVDKFINEYRHYIRPGEIKARVLTGAVL